MEGTQPAQTNASWREIPAPIRWSGLTAFAITTIGLGALTYLGKLERNIGLVATGASALGVIVFGAVLKTKPKTEETPEPQKKTLSFKDIANNDRLENVIEAIKGDADLQVLDLKDLPDEDKYLQPELFLAIAEHPALELVEWGQVVPGLWLAADWAIDLENLAKGEEIPADGALNKFLDRTDTVCLAKDVSDELLVNVAGRPNMKEARLHEDDRKKFGQAILPKIEGEQELTDAENAFLKVKGTIDGTSGWKFSHKRWNADRLASFLEKCTNLRSLNLGDAEHWGEPVATAVNALLENGCVVECADVAQLVLDNKDAPESVAFKTAAKMLTHLIPEAPKWSAATLEEVIPHLTKLWAVSVNGANKDLFTDEVVTALKAKGVERLELHDADKDLLAKFVGEVKPAVIEISGQLPDSVTLNGEDVELDFAGYTGEKLANNNIKLTANEE